MIADVGENRCVEGKPSLCRRNRQTGDCHQAKQTGGLQHHGLATTLAPEMIITERSRVSVKLDGTISLVSPSFLLSLLFLCRSVFSVFSVVWFLSLTTEFTEDTEFAERRFSSNSGWRAATSSSVSLSEISGTTAANFLTNSTF